MQNQRKQWGEAPWSRANFPKQAITAAGVRVAIIGGGLTGASTAYHLGKHGVPSTVFEAGLVGDGASGRTGGIVLEGTASGPLPGADSCLDTLENLVATEQIDCGLRRSGCWEIEHRAGSNGRKLPWDDGGKPVYIATTVDGGTVQPAALLAGIMSAAARLGAEIREHTRVVRIVMEPRLALEVAGKQIYPEYVVVAVNAWINALISNVVALRSALTFACLTEPLEPATLKAVGMNAGMPFYTADLPYLWGRTTSDGRAVFGSGLVFGAPARLEKMDASTGAAGAALAQLRNRIQSLHPKLRAVRFSGSWGGPIAFTDDTLPLLGVHPQNSRVLVSGGYAGHGVALSVHAGQLIAEAITEDRPLPDWGSLRR